MFDIRKHEPLWGKWYIDSLLGRGAFGSVYKVHQEEFNKTRFSAVKILSIPRDDEELRQMIGEGLDKDALKAYLHVCVTSILSEIDLMSQFSGNSHFVSLMDHEIIERTGSIGWDILMRMELLTSLADRTAAQPLSPAETIKMGIHICRALELCAQNRIIHRDIKPANIFVSPYGEYKLGDFGIARTLDQTLANLSQKGTNAYMAPEVFKHEPYGPCADICSLGIVMYRCLNHNRIPFLPDYPKPIMPQDRETALLRRMNGETVPDLVSEGISSGLNTLVLQACACDPRDRFESPTHMRQALEALEVPEAAKDLTSAVSLRSWSVEATRDPYTKRNRSSSSDPTANSRSDRKNRRRLIAIVSIASLVIIMAGSWFLYSVIPHPSAQWEIRSYGPNPGPDTFTRNTDTMLTTRGEKGDLWGTSSSSNNLNNIFLTDTPSGDYEFQIVLTFEPTENHQAAGLAVILDADNYLILLRRFHSLYGGRVIQFISESEGKGGSEREHEIPDTFSEKIHLRITKKGEEYRGYVSNNGQEWVLVAKQAGPEAKMNTHVTDGHMTNEPSSKTKIGFLSKGFTSSTERILIWQNFTVNGKSVPFSGL
ncbi:MAG: protein kinase [Gracilibacteraceae bacterium]|jgi:serine/threonine protein kinase|nr:protein kinase [Gracilibacteraceae bacterium]